MTVIDSSAGAEVSRSADGGIGRDEATAVLAFLEPDEAMRLAAMGRVKQLNVGETVIEGHRPADFLAFVLDGKLAVKKPASFPGRYVLLAEIERGGMTGEAAVVDLAGGPGCSSDSDGPACYGTVVEAVEPSRLLVLPRERLRGLIEDDQGLALKLLVRIVKVMRQRLRGAGERLAWIL